MFRERDLTGEIGSAIAGVSALSCAAPRRRYRVCLRPCVERLPYRARFETTVPRRSMPTFPRHFFHAGDRGVPGGVEDSSKIGLLRLGDDARRPVDGDSPVGTLGDGSHGAPERMYSWVCCPESVDYRNRSPSMPVEMVKCFLGMVGDVPGRIGRGLVVLRGINAEHRVGRPWRGHIRRNRCRRRTCRRF